MFINIFKLFSEEGALFTVFVLVNQNGPSEAKGVFDLTNCTTPKPSWH